MKLKANEAVAEGFGQAIQSEAFKIKSTGKTFEVLSSKLYKDKVSAVVREISCNAYDSHVAANKADVPFEVHLPTDFEPYFTVRDFGVGLDHEGVMNTFSMFFESTKENSNDFIGAFGLGSKSPFALVDLFTVTTYCGRFRKTYTCYKHQGVPHVGLSGESPSNEPCGLEINIPVKSEDHRKFADAATSIYRWFATKPIVNGVKIYPADRPVFKSKWAIDENTYGITALMGNVAYPVSRDLVGAKDIDINHVVLEFAVGELDVQAGREELSYDHLTIEAVKKRIEQVVKSIDRQYARMLKDCRNIFEAQITLTQKSLRDDWKALVRVRSPRYKGTKLDYRSCDTLLRNYCDYKSIRRFMSTNDYYHDRLPTTSKDKNRIPDSMKVDRFVLFVDVRHDGRDGQRFNLWVKNNPSKHGYHLRPRNLDVFLKDMKEQKIEVVLSDEVVLPSRRAKLRHAYVSSPRDAEEAEVEISEESPRCYIMIRNLEWDLKGCNKIIKNPASILELVLSEFRELRDKGGPQDIVYFPVSRVKDIPESWVNMYEILSKRYEELWKTKEFKRCINIAGDYRSFKVDHNWLYNLKQKNVFPDFFKKIDEYKTIFAKYHNWCEFIEYHTDEQLAHSNTLSSEWDALKDKYPLIFEITRPAHLKASDHDKLIVNKELKRYVEMKDAQGDEK